MTKIMKLEGFADLEKALDELTVAAGKGVLRRSLKVSAEPMADIANSLAPVGATGEYARSFVYSTKLSKRQSSRQRRADGANKAAVQGYVGTSDPAGVQQEFGNIHHGPQPALRPAWDQDRKPLVERLGKNLWAELDKSLERAKRKAARQKG